MKNLSTTFKSEKLDKAALRQLLGGRGGSTGGSGDTGDPNTDPTNPGGGNTTDPIPRPELPGTPHQPIIKKQPGFQVVVLAV